MLRCLGACTAGGEGCWSPVGILVPRDDGSLKGCWFPGMMLVPQDDVGSPEGCWSPEGHWSPRMMVFPKRDAGPPGCCWSPGMLLVPRASCFQGHEVPGHVGICTHSLLPATCGLALADSIIQINYKKPGRNYNCNQVELRSDELQFGSFFFFPSLKYPKTRSHTQTHAIRGYCHIRNPNRICERQDQSL